MMNDRDGAESIGGVNARSKLRSLNPTIIAIAVVVVISGLFILQNREFTRIDFLVFELHNRVWTAIASSILLGVLLDRLIMRWWGKRKTAKAAKNIG